jgi:polygalacturonase
MNTNKHLLTLILLLPALLHAQKNEVYSWDNLPKIEQPVFKKDTFSIIQYGAINDGISLNTKSINEAIKDCSSKGGGVVLIPEGLWLTGPVEMKSNVNLHLRRAAILLFTPDKSQYPIVEGSYEGKSAARNQSPIWGRDLQNIAITGNGVIDGNGDAWRAVHKDQLTEGQWKSKLKSGGVLSDDQRTWYPSQQFKDAFTQKKSMLLTGGKSLEDFADIKDILRPNLVALADCNKVLLEGIVFQNSPAWCLHPLLCTNLTIRNVTTKNPAYAHNGDGMDIESCSHFLVEGCTLDVGDDAICIKSGKDEEGRKRGKPTQNGVIRNNIVYKGHGGFVIGSEMSGGARNIFVEDCTFMGTDKGLRFKSTRGRGGVVENIYARNIFMKDIVQEAIFFDLYYFVKFATDGERDTRPIVNEGTPVFKNMVFENIVCNGANKGIFIRGLPEMPVQNITIKNSKLHTDKGTELTDAKDITIENVTLNCEQNPVVNINNGVNIKLDGIKYPKGTTHLLYITGSTSKNISLQNSGLKKGSSLLKTDDSIEASVLNLSN